MSVLDRTAVPHIVEEMAWSFALVDAHLEPSARDLKNYFCWLDIRDTWLGREILTRRFEIMADATTVGENANGEPIYFIDLDKVRKDQNAKA